MIDVQRTASLIAFLNEVLALDQHFLTKLVETRLPVKAALADHPTVQVVEDGPVGAPASCGLLGLLNGYCGVYDDGPYKDWGPITAIFDDAAGYITDFGWTAALPRVSSGLGTYAEQVATYDYRPLRLCFSPDAIREHYEDRDDPDDPTDDLPDEVLAAAGYAALQDDNLYAAFHAALDNAVHAAKARFIAGLPPA